MPREAPPLSADLRDAVVKACGQAFHYKESLRPVFVNAGVPGELFDRLVAQELSKYVICRAILAELDRNGVVGRRVQRAIVTELARMKTPLAEANQDEGREALSRVQLLAARECGHEENEVAATAARRRRHGVAAAARQHLAACKHELNERFNSLLKPPKGLTPQERGYEFEALLKDLFASEDIEYHGGYRVGTTEQIDGAFKLNSRDYLVEARWRKDPPGLNDLFAFVGKVENKLDGTRGLFVTMQTPRPEIVEQLPRATKRVLIMDGQDLALIFQGMWTLRDALELKADKGAREGTLFYPLVRARAA